MSTKRQILQTLQRGELLDILDVYDPEVADRRVRDEILDALTRSRSASLAAILSDLPRKRLKQICRDLDMDDSGREIALIVDRLMTYRPRTPHTSEVTPKGTSAPTRSEAPATTEAPTEAQAPPKTPAPATPLLEAFAPPLSPLGDQGRKTSTTTSSHPVTLKSVLQVLPKGRSSRFTGESVACCPRFLGLDGGRACRRRNNSVVDWRRDARAEMSPLREIQDPEETRCTRGPRSFSRPRGTIALVESGTGEVRGVCELVDVIGPLTPEELRKKTRKHKVPTAAFGPEWRYAKTYA